MSKNEIRWVILDHLPKIECGCNLNRIDWSQSVGYSVPFRYDEVTGDIQIVGHRVMNSDDQQRRSILLITIDKYVPEPIEVRTDVITNCQLGNLVKNRIINLAPQLIKYLSNPDDAYKYTYQSNKKVKTRCPICGHEDEMSVNNLYGHGFFCPSCSDTATIPNKLMMCILKQLNIPFIREVNRRHFAWMKQYLYDYYICINNENILIEMDGWFHTLPKQQEIDMIKTRLANENNFKLIRIDSNYNNNDPLSYIKTNILHSELVKILNLNLVDWEICKQFIVSNLILQECKLWELGYSIGDIMQEFGLCKNTVRAHLIKGRDIGICPTYTKEESWRRGKSLITKPVAFIDNNKIIYVFNAASELEHQSLSLFGVHCNRNRIADVCAGNLKSYRGLHFKYITKEEYLQYKMIENNEVVLKEAI